MANVIPPWRLDRWHHRRLPPPPHCRLHPKKVEEEEATKICIFSSSSDRSPPKKGQSGMDNGVKPRCLNARRASRKNCRKHERPGKKAEFSLQAKNGEGLSTKMAWISLSPPSPPPYSPEKKREFAPNIYHTPPLPSPLKKGSRDPTFLFLLPLFVSPFLLFSVTGVTKISTINPFLPPPFLFPVRQGKKMHLAADEIFPYTKKNFSFLTVLFSTHTLVVGSPLPGSIFFFDMLPHNFFWLTSWHIWFFFIFECLLWDSRVGGGFLTSDIFVRRFLRRFWAKGSIWFLGTICEKRKNVYRFFFFFVREIGELDTHFFITLEQGEGF